MRIMIREGRGETIKVNLTMHNVKHSKVMMHGIYARGVHRRHSKRCCMLRDMGEIQFSHYSKYL